MAPSLEPTRVSLRFEESPKNWSSTTELAHLDVGRCVNVPGRAITRFANAFKARLLAGKSVPLKVLKLKHVTKAALSVIAQVFPALEVSDVSWCSGVNDAALRGFIA